MLMQVHSSFFAFRDASFLNGLSPAQKFHELVQAYELLLDPLRRSALDNDLLLRLSRKSKLSSSAAKRDAFREDLEKRESDFQKAREKRRNVDENSGKGNEVREQGDKLRKTTWDGLLRKRAWMGLDGSIVDEGKVPATSIDSPDVSFSQGTKVSGTVQLISDAMTIVACCSQIFRCRRRYRPKLMPQIMSLSLWHACGKLNTFRLIMLQGGDKRN